MDLLDDMLGGTAVYWAPTGVDDYNHTTFASPIQLPVRWVDQQSLFTNAKGEQKISKAIVYIRQDVLLDGALRLGTIASLTDSSNPFANTNAWQIQLFKKTPTIDYDDFLRVVTL